LLRLLVWIVVSIVEVGGEVWVSRGMTRGEVAATEVGEMVVMDGGAVMLHTVRMSGIGIKTREGSMLEMVVSRDMEEGEITMKKGEVVIGVTREELRMLMATDTERMILGTSCFEIKRIEVWEDCQKRGVSAVVRKVTIDLNVLILHCAITVEPRVIWLQIALLRMTKV
jgi:hypothetical protein